MKKSYIILVILFSLLSSCSKNSENKIWNEIEKTNQIESIVEFLIENPTTRNFNKAINKYQKIIESREYLSRAECFENCKSINIYTNNNFLYNNENNKLELIENESYNFLTKETNSRSNYKLKINNTLVTPKWFEIIYVKDSCEVLQPVIEKLAAGIKKYRNDISKEAFSKKFKDLTQNEKNEMKILTKHILNFIQFENGNIFYRNQIPPPSEELFK